MLAAALGLGALLFAKAMVTPLDHDEHQFVASAALLARHGLVPYRDFAYFHTPYLVYAYAAIFRLTGRLLLAARTLSALCGTATVLLTAFAVCRVWRRRGPAASIAAGALAAVLLAGNSLFIAADGLAWNHDVSELLMLAATLLVLRETSRSYRSAPLFAGGFLMGLGIGVRLTVAPAAAVLIGFPAADRTATPRQRCKAAIACAAGLATALAPCGLLFLLSPANFLFGNFEYPTLNTAWRIASGYAHGLSPASRLTFFVERVLLSPGNLPLTAAVLLAICLAVTGLRPANHPNRKQLTFLGLVCLFLLSGCFAPCPLFQVYFYAPVPIVILWLAFYFAGVPDVPFSPRLRAIGTAIAAGGAACLIAGDWRTVRIIEPDGRVPLRIHDLGRRLRAAIHQPGPVLTLAPIVPLEGGMDIYAGLVTGPFGMRVASMISEAREASTKLVDEDDLPELARQRLPSAVWIEGRPENGPMIDYAESRGLPTFFLDAHGRFRGGSPDSVLSQSRTFKQGLAQLPASHDDGGP